jgi:ABC-type lipoprotein release transport system permease subunit
MIDTLRTFLALAWRNLWRNSRRTMITLVVVSVGLWSVLFFNAFLNAWTSSSKENALGMLIGSGQIHAESFLDDPRIEAVMGPPSTDLRAVLDGPAVADWTTRLTLPGVVQSEYKTLPVTLVGVDPQSELQISSIPGRVVEGRYLEGADDEGVVLGLHMAERLKTGLGRRVILMSQNTEGSLSEQSFHVVGLFDADQGTEDFFGFIGLATGQEFLGLDDEITQISLRLASEDALDPSFDQLRQVAPELDVRTWKDINIFLASTDGAMGIFIFVWLSVVFSLMAIGIVNTQLMAVFERTQEFGLLRAMGMKPRQVLLMVTMESAMLIGAGVLLGAALAALTIWSFSDGIDLSAVARAVEMFQGGEVIYLKYHADGFLIFSLVIWLLGILVALWPARRASKSSPVEAMRRTT